MLIEQNNEDSLAYYYRATSEWAKGDIQGAVGDFSSCIKFRKDYDMAYFNRGKLLYKMGQFSDAVVDFETYLAMKPKDVEAASLVCVCVCACAIDDGFFITCIILFPLLVSLPRNQNA